MLHAKQKSAPHEHQCCKLKEKSRMDLKDFVEYNNWFDLCLEIFGNG